MIFRSKKKKQDPGKAEKLESKADGYVQNKKFKKALKTYREAADLNPKNPALYEKMIDVKTHVEGEWSEEDFSESLDWTMKKQELENPALKDLYEKLSPEYEQIKQVIAQMMMTPPEMREPLILKIKAFREKAVLPLIDTLLSIEAIAREAGTHEGPQAPSGTSPEGPGEEPPSSSSPTGGNEV